MTHMIASTQPRANEVGLEVLRLGGNAIDAAVTAAFVQGVIAPQACGLGGGGELLYYDAASAETTVIEFHPRAGSKVHPAQWLDLFERESDERYTFPLRGGVNDIGHTSVGVPGMVRGLHEALTRYGTISWEDALRPAIAFARRGLPVSYEMFDSWVLPAGPGMVGGIERLLATAESRRIFTKEGLPYSVGEVIPMSDYADTLERLASCGPDDFYVGDIARRLIADSEDHGGSLTAEDMSEYRVRRTAPLTSTYRGMVVVTGPPPCVGLSLIQMLNLLETYPAEELVADETALYERLAEALAWSAEDRSRHIADPDYADIPVSWLMDKAYAAVTRGQLENRGASSRSEWRPEDRGTTHLNVVDRAGNAVALTHSLGSSSGVVAPGLGFMLNDVMNAFDPRPGRANSIQAGKTRTSMMSPVLVFDQGTLRIVAGAPGGTRIVGSIVQVLINLIDRGDTALEAVCRPRIDAQWPRLIEAEGRIPSSVIEALRAKGNVVNYRQRSWDPFFATPQVTTIDRNGRMSGASDPRGGGTALLEN